MKLCLLLLLTLPLTLFTQVQYKTGEISINGFSGFSHISNPSMETIGFLSTTVNSREVKDNNFSILINSDKTNFFIDSRGDYLNLSLGSRIIKYKNLNLNLSSTYTQGDISPGIHHNIGIGFLGPINTYVYYSKAFYTTYKRGDRFLLSLQLKKKVAGSALVFYGSQNYITSKQQVLDNSLGLIYNAFITLKFIKLENNGELNKIEEYYKRSNTLKLTLNLGQSFPYLGYMYEDLDRDGSLKMKHSYLIGSKLSLKNNLTIDIDGVLSIINSPFYKVSSKIDFKLKYFNLIPYIKYELIDTHTISPGVKGVVKLHNLTISGEFSYKSLERDNWEIKIAFRDIK